MKIITWNVNGLRAFLKKGMWDWISSQSPDLVCLQEIKARPDQLSDEQHGLFHGYHAFWFPAERPGYSGVVTFSKHEPLEYAHILDEERFDREGRVNILYFSPFVLLNIYFPNGQRDHTRLKYKLDFYSRTLDICDDLMEKGYQVVICGDFNTAHREIDLRNPKENQKTSGFLPEERAWVDRYLDHGFVDIFRTLNPEKVQYTWWTYRFNARSRNIGWRLDYFLVSQGLVDKVKDVIIHDEVPGSDHCPVSLLLGDEVRMLKPFE